MTPTAEQEAIRLAVRETKDSLMIPALAGTGKTTTLTLVAKEIKVPGLALAFNTHIKKELEKRFPPNFSVQTMNGLGFGSLRRAMPQILNWTVEDKKLGKIVNEVAKDWGVELSQDDWDCLRQIAFQAMANGIVPGDEGDRPIVPDTPEVWQDLALDQLVDKDSLSLMADFAREIVKRNNELVRQGKISFFDQIYYSVCVQGKFPLFPVLMVDEAQDLDPLQHRMLELACRPDGRLIVCGDPKQAIYAFRGADSESMAKIKRLRTKWIELPLTLTFRCPKAVVERQLWHAPQYRAHKSNPQGQFLKLPVIPPEASPESFTELMWTWEEFEKLRPARGEAAILCRNNAPLLSLAFQLLRQRVPCRMLGRDIGKGLVALSRKITPKDEVPADQHRQAIDEWQEQEEALLRANGKEEKIAGIVDRCECLRAVLDQGVARTAGELRREVTALFARETGRVTLSSIHKSKGLEWDLVMLLDPWRIPSKWALREAEAGNDAQLRQEHNLKYVAETRSKQILVHANAKEFM